MLGCAVEPVLSVPVSGGALDFFGRNWSVDVFFRQFVVCDFVFDGTECVVEGVLGCWLEYVSEFQKVLMILFKGGHSLFSI